MEVDKSDHIFFSKIEPIPLTPSKKVLNNVISQLPTSQISPTNVHIKKKNLRGLFSAQVEKSGGIYINNKHTEQRASETICALED